MSQDLKSLYELTFEKLETLSNSVQSRGISSDRNLVDLTRVEKTSFWKRDVSRQDRKREARKEKMRKRIRKDVVINKKPSYFFKAVGRNLEKQEKMSASSISLSCGDNVSLSPLSPSFTFSKTSRKDNIIDKNGHINDCIYIGPKQWCKSPLTDEEEVRSIREYLRSPLNTADSSSLEEHVKAISQQRRLRRRALARMIQIRRGHSNNELRLSSSRRSRDRQVHPFGSTVRRFYEEER